MTEKKMTNPDSSKVFCRDCIPVVILKNCKFGLSYIYQCMFKKIFFSDCRKFSLVVPVFMSVGRSTVTQINCLVSLLPYISKVS